MLTIRVEFSHFVEVNADCECGKYLVARQAVTPRTVYQSFEEEAEKDARERLEREMKLRGWTGAGCPTCSKK